MQGLIHWYNINRKKIWKIIGIILITIVMIQLINKIVAKNKKIPDPSFIASNNNTETNYNSITLEEDKSTVSGEDITNKQRDVLKIIDEFINYCNNSQINEAYNLLSEDCKNEMYSTVEQFKQTYYNKIFEGKRKNISVENWIGNIYKVKYIEDALSTGIYSTENNIQDYITIVNSGEDNIKININNYIGKEDISKEQQQENINIKVIEKHKYMDYEIYVFEIKNNSDNIILLNDRNSIETLYLEDKNDLKYQAYTHELSEAQLKLIPGEKKKLSIKFYNKYSSSKKINNIVFSKIILNYNDYITSKDVAIYKNYRTIKIEL